MIHIKLSQKVSRSNNDPLQYHWVKIGDAEKFTMRSTPVDMSAGVLSKLFPDIKDARDNPLLFSKIRVTGVRSTGAQQNPQGNSAHKSSVKRIRRRRHSF